MAIVTKIETPDGTVMNLGDSRKVNFGRDPISALKHNEDTWVATHDGIMLIQIAQSINGVWYVYMYDDGSYSAAMSGTDGTGGLRKTTCCPITKGHTYKLVIGGSASEVACTMYKLFS